MLISYFFSTCISWHSTRVLHTTCSIVCCMLCAMCYLPYSSRIDVLESDGFLNSLLFLDVLSCCYMFDCLLLDSFHSASNWSEKATSSVSSCHQTSFGSWIWRRVECCRWSHFTFGTNYFQFEWTWKVLVVCCQSVRHLAVIHHQTNASSMHFSGWKFLIFVGGSFLVFFDTRRNISTFGEKWDLI